MRTPSFEKVRTGHAIAKYQGLGFTHWTGNAGSTHRQYLTSATFAVDMSPYGQSVFADAF